MFLRYKALFPLMFNYNNVKSLLYLWGISVVKHAKDNVRHGVDSVIGVGWRCKRGQVVLQGFTQHTVECNIRPQNVTLLPAVLLQLLHLGPETVQILQRDTKDIHLVKR